MLDGTATEVKSTKCPRGTVGSQSIGGSMLNRHCMIALMTPHHNNIDADQSMDHDAETVSKHTIFPRMRETIIGHRPYTHFCSRTAKSQASPIVLRESYALLKPSKHQN
jgi:hypothetical protein